MSDNRRSAALTRNCLLTGQYFTPMRITHLQLLGGLVSAVLATLLAANAGAAPAGTSALPAENSGAYIAIAADCASCHTAPGGKPFAGGTPLKTPLGIIYGSNITSDPTTGIGAWSEADFDRALREGVRKDGAYLYPAMPYANYTKMTAKDMHALWNYVHNVEAVRNAVPKNTLKFPFDLREGMFVWQSLNFKPGEFVPAPDKGADWNRGAYLVDALGHCDQCHTPRNVTQGLKAKSELSGAQIEGWYAPNISGNSLSEIHDWSEPSLVKFLKTGAMPGNTKVVGPMQEVIHESLGRLSDADLRAMAVYLKGQSADTAPVATSRGDWPRQAGASGLYQDHCASCHQSDGHGIPGTVPALKANDVVTTAEPSNVIMAMLEGVPAQGPWGAMGSFADALTDEQIADITNYVRTTWGNHGAPNATPWGVARLRKYAAAPNDQSGASARTLSSSMLCPNLDAAAIKPALAMGPGPLASAAVDRAKMADLVRRYEAAVPRATKGEVIEALSTAYCKNLAEQPMSQARMSGKIADFAQNAALSLSGGKH